VRDVLGVTYGLGTFQAGDAGIAAGTARMMDYVCNDEQYNNISPSLYHPIGAYSMSIRRATSAVCQPQVSRTSFLH
jgi:hypothetical protein